MEENNFKICPNCSAQLFDEQKFCSNCGQKNQELKIRFWEFIVEFFNTVLNIENKFFTTLAAIFFPGRLTIFFFEGKRKSFYHPLRIYFVSIIILFFMLSRLQLGDIVSIGSSSFDKNLVEDIIRTNEDQKRISAIIDSLELEFQTKAQLEVLDSFRNAMYFVVGGDTLRRKDTLDQSNFNIDFFGKEIEFSGKDLYEKEPEQIIEETGIEKWYQKLLLTQVLKIVRNPGDLNKYLFANLSWLLLALIPVFGFIMKIFYLRRKRYYVEHIVFLLHVFSSLMIFASFVFLIILLFNLDPEISGLVIAMAFIFPIFSFKYYYNQSWVKTIFKYLVISFFFFIAFIICFALFTVIASLLY